MVDIVGTTHTGKLPWSKSFKLVFSSFIWQRDYLGTLFGMVGIVVIGKKILIGL